MPTSISEQAVQTMEVTKDEEIAAPIDVVFETILEQMGPLNETPDGTPMPMVIEAWPGGRWYRDLGKDTGHLWGHVQSIKAPTLLEIHGPLFMSGPAVSNVMYRLTAERGITRLKFSHRVVGLIGPELDSSKVNAGWGSIVNRIREVAETKRGREINERGDKARGCFSCAMDRGAKGFPGERKGIHPTARRVKPTETRTALGESGEAICV